MLRQHADRAVAAITHGLSALGVACVVAMMVITTADVVARYVFNRPTMWADEMASYLLIAIVFLGLAHNLRTDGHIRIDAVTNLLPLRARALLEVFAYAVGIVFAGILFFGTWTRFENFWSRSPLMTPLWIAMVPVVLGALVFGLAMIVGFIGSFHALLSRRAPPDDAPDA
jgi:C4-dicarboxylate transporter DctQ subunit